MHYTKNGESKTKLGRDLPASLSPGASDTCYNLSTSDLLISNFSLLCDICRALLPSCLSSGPPAQVSHDTCAHAARLLALLA